MKHTVILLLCLFNFSICVDAQVDQLKWLKSFFAYSFNANLSVDKNDNIYVSLEMRDSIDMDLGPGQHWVKSEANQGGIVIGKYSKFGDLLWTGLLSGDISSQGLSLSFDKDFNMYFSGRFEDTIDVDPSNNISKIVSNGQLDFFVIKLNSTGGLVWAKNFGSTNLDFISSSIADSKGNVFLTGNFRGNMDFDPGNGTDIRSITGNTDLYLIKLNANGEYQWGLQFGADQSSGYSLNLDPYENVILSGQYVSSSNFNPKGTAKNHTSFGNRDFFVARYNQNGLLIHSFTGGGTQYDLGMSVTYVKDYGFYLFGNFRGTATFDANDISKNMTSTSSVAHFAARYDTTGKCLWRLQMPVYGSEFLYYNSVLPDKNGNAYVIADFNLKLDMDPGSDSLMFTSAGSADVFIRKLNSQGDLLWAKKIGSKGLEDIHGACLDNNENLILLGTFSDSCLFEIDSLPILKRTELTSKNEFLLKYGKVNSNGILDMINTQIHVYPNPSIDHLLMSGLPVNSTVTVYNSQGQVLGSYKLNETTFQLNTSTYAIGNYIVIIQSGDTIYSRKVSVNR